MNDEQWEEAWFHGCVSSACEAAEDHGLDQFLEHFIKCLDMEKSFPKREKDTRKMLESVATLSAAMINHLFDVIEINQKQTEIDYDPPML